MPRTTNSEQSARRWQDRLQVRMKRVEAVSHLLAAEASEEPDVAWFRSWQLPNGLLSPERVEQWVFLNARGAEAPDQPGQEDTPETPEPDNHKRLVYVSHDGARRAVHVLAETVLDQLRKLSIQLATDFNWDQGQATHFILTGEAPGVSDWKVTTQVRGKHSVNTRMIITVDPSLTPADVANLYAQARSSLATRQLRNLTEKHLELAVFNSLQPSESTWRDKMEIWNREHPVPSHGPEYQYTEPTNFARDCANAKTRLLDPYGKRQKQLEKNVTERGRQQ
jgi:hypothetical protein